MNDDKVALAPSWWFQTHRKCFAPSCLTGIFVRLTFKLNVPCWHQDIAIHSTSWRASLSLARSSFIQTERERKHLIHHTNYVLTCLIWTVSRYRHSSTLKIGLNFIHDKFHLMKAALAFARPFWSQIIRDESFHRSKKVTWLCCHSTPKYFWTEQKTGGELRSWNFEKADGWMQQLQMEEFEFICFMGLQCSVDNSVYLYHYDAWRPPQAPRQCCLSNHSSSNEEIFSLKYHEACLV